MKKLLLGSSILIFFLTTATNSLAAGVTTGIYNPVKFGSLAEVIQKALPIVFTLTAFLAVVIFSLGAVKYISSRGDAKAADSARSTMTGAVIGLIIVLSSVAVNGILANTLGSGLFGAPATNASPNGTFDLSCAFRLSKDGQCVGARFGDLGSLVSVILLLIVSAGAAIFFLMLLWNGIRYMMSRGDDKAIGEARSGLTNAFVGLLLLIASFIIIRLLATTVFGFKSF